jgi:tetratricopeptide (TPR) repeat protein
MPPAAEELYRKALAIDEKLGNLEGIANAYLNLGNILEIRGDVPGAEQMYKTALELAGRLGSVSLRTECKLCLRNLPEQPSEIPEQIN